MLNLDDDNYEEYIYSTKASIALVNNTFKPKKELPKTLTLIKVANAYESLAQLLAYYDEINNQNASYCRRIPAAKSE